MLRIVTDSSVDLPPDLVRDLAITVVPLSIHFGDKTYIDGEDIDADAFYRLLQSESTHPRTAQPSVGRFEEAYRALIADGHEVLAITLGSSFSGTYNSAALAARSLPEAPVTVIDSGTVSMAMGSIVMRAARMARAGDSSAEIAAVVHEMTTRTKIYVVLDTLTYLQRGGRIGRASALVGTVLNIKPILTIQEATVMPLKRVRTRSKALHEIVDLAATQAPIKEMYVMHTLAEEDARSLAEQLRALNRGETPPVLPLGPVVGVHVGPGALGVTMLLQRPDPS